MLCEAISPLLVVSGVAIVVAMPVVGVRSYRNRRRLVAGAILLLLLGGALLLFQTRERTLDGAGEAVANLLPGRRVEGGYVTSQSCRKCHADQFSSWHHSYHRTMTQAVSPETVEAPFDDVVIELQGYKYHLTRRGDEFWINMPDPIWYLAAQAPEAERPKGLPDKPPQVDRRIVMSTGSHHMQLYWVLDPATQQLVNVPLIYLIDEKRWVPRADVFLEGKSEPYESRLNIQTWNKVCVACHSVAGQPRLELADGQPDTRVVELGIACEACHGPGKAHVKKHEGLDHRPTLGGTEPKSSGDPTIVNPARCDAQTSAQICGRCHSVHSVVDHESYWNEVGDTFRPGQNLHDSRLVVRDPRQIALEQGADPETATATHGLQSPEMLRHFFWPDGFARVAGREYNGLLETACHQRGDMSCVSCHSLHAGERDDQLAVDMRGNQACYQCHAEYEEQLSEHTHHAADSEGSRCYNCHMPHTTYGLMKAIRSHTVSSPSVEESTKYGRPNACNLCHLDQTLEWTGEHLTSWYGQPQVELDEESRTTSAALNWMLRGDGGQRALVAWHFGWEPAQQISGTDWMPPFLAELLVDPYSTVRHIAHKSLREREGFEDFAYDFVGPLPSRAKARKAALDRWHALPHKVPPEKAPKLFMKPDGTLEEESIRRMMGHRDERRMELYE